MIAILLLEFLAALLGDYVEKWAEIKHAQQKGLILGVLLGAVIALNVFSGVYYMNNLIYMIPMKDSVALLKDSWWIESNYLLYISK